MKKANIRIQGQVQKWTLETKTDERRAIIKHIYFYFSCSRIRLIDLFQNEGVSEEIV